MIFLINFKSYSLGTDTLIKGDIKINSKNDLFSIMHSLDQATTAVTSYRMDHLFFGNFLNENEKSIFMINNNSGFNRFIFKNSSGISEVVTDKISRSAINGYDKFLVGNFNSDNYSDILAINGSSGSNRLFLNDGYANFSIVDNVILQSKLLGYPNLYSEDITGDGYSDIFGVDFMTGNNRVYINKENNTFESDSNRIDVSELNDFSHLVIGKFDSSNDMMDIFAFNEDDGRNLLFENLGNAQFSQGVSTIDSSLINSSGRLVQNVYGVDFNLDGYDDFVVNYEDDKSDFYRNSKSNTFVEYDFENVFDKYLRKDEYDFDVFLKSNTEGVFKIGDTITGVDEENLKLSVDGTGVFKKVIVTQQNWPDYVFKKDYNLPKLEDVEKHISEKQHLPEVPSAQEAESEGVSIGDMQKVLLKKIEELMLYTIKQEKSISSQNIEIKVMRDEIERLKGDK